LGVSLLPMLPLYLFCQACAGSNFRPNNKSI
jgi:hypothetical protein